MGIKIREGNIVEAKVDAIVNAANPKMLGGGGVDGAIHQAAGPKLLEECRKVKSIDGIRCPFGEARITFSGNLPSKFVIHTSGPIYGYEPEPHAVLASSYENSLKLALENNCRSIAFGLSPPMKSAPFSRSKFSQCMNCSAKLSGSLRRPVMTRNLMKVKK